jgi:hypothetical protein
LCVSSIVATIQVDKFCEISSIWILTHSCSFSVQFPVAIS